MVKHGILAQVHTGEETGNGSSQAFPSQGERLGVAAHASAVGTSLDLEVEWSPDGTNFGSASTPDSLAQITTADQVEVAVFDVKAPYYRVTWTLAGGNSTFVVTTH